MLTLRALFCSKCWFYCSLLNATSGLLLIYGIYVDPVSQVLAHAPSQFWLTLSAMELDARIVTTQRKRKACGDLRSFAVELGVARVGRNADLNREEFDGLHAALVKRASAAQHQFSFVNLYGI